MKKLLENDTASRILFLVLSFAIMMVIITYSTISEKNKSEAKAVSIETSTACINEITPDESEIVEAELLEAKDASIESEDEEIDSSEPLESAKDYFGIILNDIDNLKNADLDTVTKYFGVSDVFTPEIIADRVSVTTVSYIGSSVDDSENTVVNIHICTIDYNLMNSDYSAVEAEQKIKYDKAVSKGETPELNYTESAKKIIATNLIEDKYNICYNIPVTIIDDSVVISESLKQAITGGWYTGVGVELTPVECIVK